MHYQPATDELRFILDEVLQAPAQWQRLTPFADLDAGLMHQVLEEAATFVADKVAPLHAIGDAEGCRLEAGRVRTPAGFSQAYADFWRAGWASLSCAVEDGGQGLPEVLNQVLYEMLSAANHGWTMAPGLLHGAYECLRHHASTPLKALYLPRVASGEWLATMCLTEAQAGSDLGLIRTRATPDSSGSHATGLLALGPVHRLSGTKIFISGGEHDLTENIVHLVLARLPDALPGPKGLTLLLAPKYLPGGERNGVCCERIEEKMGLHGSATCVLRFDDAIGWIVGEPGKGLAAMFTMMNAARLHVALQGVGLLDAAWQRANGYSQERRQMRAPGHARAAPGAADAADFIHEHPAIKRILQTQRAWIDGGRVLAYRTALELDIARHAADAESRKAAERWCGLVTPVLKAAFTEQAFLGASDCLQVFGGHGYVREWGIEQIVRDARITMIYEGTNEIQAIDLLLRKVLGDGGRGLDELLAGLCAEMAEDPCAAELEQAASRAIRMTGDLRKTTMLLVEAVDRSSEARYWVAGDYLRAVALTLLAWAWVRIDRANTAGHARWCLPATALRDWVLPEFDMRLGLISARMAR